MIPYIALTALIALCAVISPGKRVRWIPWSLMFLLLVWFVGLRHKVGMDWNNYVLMIKRASAGTYLQATQFAEPGYAFLLWMSGQMGWSMYGTNLIGTLILMAGLFKYAKTTPSPWLALTVAMPMLVIVVAMSANRQAVAIGVLLWLVASWDSLKPVSRAAIVLLATMFHTSAALFFAFIFADAKMNRYLKGVLLVAVAYISFFYVGSTGKADYYSSTYVTSQTESVQSSGALLHVLYNGLPALLTFFVFRKHKDAVLKNGLYKNMALLAIALIPASFYSSAASGRLVLYLFPVSMMFFSSLPYFFVEHAFRRFVVIMICFFMIFLSYLWLAHSNSNKAHIPYSNAMTTESSKLFICCK